MKFTEIILKILSFQMTENLTFGEAREKLLEEAEKGALSTKTRTTTSACKLQELEPGDNTPAWNSQERIEYGFNCLDYLEQFKKGKLKPDWDLLRFRAEKEFRAGSFNSMVPVWFLISNQLRPEVRSEIYHTIHKGINLFDNLRAVPEKDPVKYKNFTFFTEKRENPDTDLICLEPATKGKNLRILSENPLVTARETNKSKSGDYTYYRKVNVPVVRKNGEIQPLCVRNPKTITSYHSVVMKQIRKWIKCGSLEWIPQSLNPKPLLVSSMVIAPKAGPELYRICYNGGPIKFFEQNKQPCHLDTAKQV